MTFEAFVIDVQEATYTVRNAANGAIYHNCHLCTMGVADWCISKDDYVLCKQTDMGHVYIIGEIKARPPSTKGFRIGANGSDEFVITEEGTLLHERGMNSTMISDDGYEATYQKVIINGLGTKVEITEDQVLITVGTSAIMMTPTEIKLCGDTSGGILKGKEAQDQINDIADKLKTHIEKYLVHSHDYLPGPGSLAPSSGPGGSASTPASASSPAHTAAMIPVPTKPALQSTVVKSS